MIIHVPVLIAHHVFTTGCYHVSQVFACLLPFPWRHVNGEICASPVHAIGLNHSMSLSLLLTHLPRINFVRTVAQLAELGLRVWGAATLSRSGTNLGSKHDAALSSSWMCQLQVYFSVFVLKRCQANHSRPGSQARSHTVVSLDPCKAPYLLAS